MYGTREIHEFYMHESFFQNPVLNEITDYNENVVVYMKYNFNLIKYNFNKILNLLNIKKTDKVERVFECLNVLLQAIYTLTCDKYSKVLHKM